MTFMTELSLFVIFKMKKAKMDVISVYLQIAYRDKARPILVTLGKRICNLIGINPDILYRVKKYVYRLPDAGRQFYLGFTKVLAEKGYTMSKCDPCLFYRMFGGEKTFICIHVDDCYVFSNKAKYLDILKKKVEEVYPVSMNCNSTGFLGIFFLVGSLEVDIIGTSSIAEGCLVVGS
jgi:hypothetical protein